MLTETTPEHPFYTNEGEWVAASELEKGDQIQRADGTVGKVEDISILQHVEVMYNLTVDTAHTFYIGEGQWLVHNICSGIEDDLDDFRDAANEVVGNDGMTAAGRAYQKHSGPNRPNAANWPRLG